MKQVDATFNIYFATDQGNKLPTARQMSHELQELFAAVLDQYLSEKDIESDEVHLILCNDFSVEELTHDAL